MSLDISDVVHSAGKHHAAQAGPLKAVHPSLNRRLGTLDGGGLIFCRGCQQKDLFKSVIGIVERVGSVEQCFQLSAYAVIVTGVAKTNTSASCIFWTISTASSRMTH